MPPAAASSGENPLHPVIPPPTNERDADAPPDGVAALQVNSTTLTPSPPALEVAADEQPPPDAATVPLLPDERLQPIAATNRQEGFGENMEAGDDFILVDDAPGNGADRLAAVPAAAATLDDEREVAPVAAPLIVAQDASAVLDSNAVEASPRADTTHTTKAQPALLPCSSAHPLLLLLLLPTSCNTGQSMWRRL